LQLFCKKDLISYTTGGAHMKRTVVLLLLLLVFGFIFSISITGARENKIQGHELNLSKKILRILSAEMNAVQRGMTNLSIAVPSAKWEDIILTAKKMKEGYIMQKKLSKKEMIAFHRSIPTGYKELDIQFNEIAGQLLQAAEQHDAEKVSLYLYQLNESCIKCHSKYAAKRFPDFK